MVVAEACVETDEMLGLLCGVHGYLSKPVFLSPVLTGLEEGTTDTLSLDSRVDCELMYGGDPGPCEVLAFVLVVGWLHNDGTREFAVGFDNVALPAFDALCRDLWALVYGGVVEAHSAETCVGAMYQVSEFEQRVARLKCSDLRHVNDLNVTPNV